jgi:hypothetical protein
MSRNASIVNNTGSLVFTIFLRGFSGFRGRIVSEPDRAHSTPMAASGARVTCSVLKGIVLVLSFFSSEKLAA